MKLHQDVAIDKVLKLSFDVHMQDMLRKWDDLYERNKDMFDQTKENAPKSLGAQAVAREEADRNGRVIICGWYIC